MSKHLQLKRPQTITITKIYGNFIATMDIESIISQIRERKRFGIERLRYNPINDYKTELEFFCELGKIYNPRFVVDEHNRFVYLNLIKWALGDDTMKCHSPKMHPKGQPFVDKGELNKGIFLAGNTGSGKTLAMYVLREFCHVHNLKVNFNEYHSPEQQLSWEIVGTKELNDIYISKGNIMHYERTLSLCINDIGAENVNAMYMGNKLEVLRGLMEHRGDRQGLLTMATSNLPFWGTQFKERYGDRVVSRCYGMFNYFELFGIDRRNNN